MTALSQPGHFTTARATNFYYSFLFLPREKRRAIEAVYAFARQGDDLADQGLPAEVVRRQLASYRQTLEACYTGGQGDDFSRPELAALGEAVRRFMIPRRHFEDLILGFEMDLEARRYETFGELSEYCYRVASTIGLIAIEIFGYRNPRTRDYAVNLGIALQLVNILRDLKSDAKRGRVYIPREDLERFGIQSADLAADPSGRDGFVELMQFECDRAQRYFNLAREMLTPEDRRSMVAAEIMAAVYWRLLHLIRKRRYNVFGNRIQIARPVKFWTAFSVYFGAEWLK